MLHLLLKEKLPSIFYNQFIPGYIIFILGIILTYKKYSPLVTGVSMAILYFYSYFIHKLFHYLPIIMNIHLNFHHNHSENKKIMYKYLNLVVELFSNIMFFVIFYYIQKVLGLNFVPEILIFYYGFIYVSIHIINYSIFHSSEAHILHHVNSSSIEKNKNCNYGPDLVDHIFFTNCNKNIENYNHIIINTLLSFLFTYYFYKPQIF